MQRYHLEVEGIPEYMNMLEDAQRQAGWAVRAISDDTLLIFASTAMLTSDQFPRSNDAWGTGRNQTRRGRRGNLLISKPTPRRELRLRPTGATPSSGRPIQPPAHR